MSAAEAAPSLQACADALRAETVGLAGALRWLRRRLDPVRALLPLVLTLLPGLLRGCAPSLAAVRRHLGLGGECALEHLRRRLGEVLGALASPLGFRRRGTGGGAAVRGPQQPMGPDPPAAPG